RLRTLFSYHVLSRSESYALSLHDALPIWAARDHDRDRRAAVDLLVRRGLGPDHAPLLDVLGVLPRGLVPEPGLGQRGLGVGERLDRKSTRLNSSHVKISYAVFCVIKKSEK